MKHFLQKLLPLILALALLCASAPGVLAEGEDAGEGSVEADSLALNAEALSLAIGEAGTLTATLTFSSVAEGAEIGPVSWTAGKDENGDELVSIGTAERKEEAGETENSKIVTVSVPVTGLKAGETVITAAYGGRTAVCAVSVKRISVEGAALTRATMSIPAGETGTLVATITPGNATNQTVLWSVSQSSEHVTLSKTTTRSGESVTVTGRRSGTATVTATTEDGGYTVQCAVTVTATTLSASLSNGQLDFSRLIFELDERCQNITGSSLSYLTNISVNTGEGTLYDGYVSESDHNEGVSGAQKYYNSHSGDHQLSRITFIPRAGFTGNATITFTGYSTSSGAFSGTITVPVGGTPLSYTSEDGEPVCFRSLDFTNYSQSHNHSTIKYVRFDLPSTRFGTLYYNYIDGDINEGTVSSATLYYRTGSPSLDKVWFVPSSSYSGNVTITFTACDTAGYTFSGSLLIHVMNVAGSTGNTSLAYSVRPGGTVAFNSANFNDLSYERTNYPLNYLYFTSLPIYNRGTLYCDGYGSGAVNVNQYFYRTGSNRRLISEVYFTAYSGFTGTVSIPFVAHATSGATFRGTVTITVSASAAATNPSASTGESTIYDTGSMIVYSGSGEAVPFNNQDFYAEAQRHLAGSLSTVCFYTPDAAQGRLCLNYISPASYTPLNTSTDSTEYPAAMASLISFLPRAGFSGAAYVRYVASDESGKSYTGTLAVNVTPPAASNYFDDMGGYAWAVPSADFLARYNIVTGTGYRAFSPDGLTRRGDFILMLQRCFGFPSVGDIAVFDDVSAWSYYGPAIAGAYYAGLTNGDGEGNFRPEAALTRQEAAVLLYRCMQRSGSMPGVTMADIEGFADQAQIAPYAMTAVATLARLGVLTGSGGYLNPTQLLTRAEMATMFHRALT